MFISKLWWCMSLSVFVLSIVTIEEKIWSFEFRNKFTLKELPDFWTRTEEYTLKGTEIIWQERLDQDLF